MSVPAVSSTTRAWPARVVTGLAALWAAALPWAAGAGQDAEAAPSAMAAVVYAVGQVLCHQRPERSFHWGVQPWPVCARCTGIYAGAAVGVLLAGLLRRQRLPGPAHVRLWLAGAVLPSGITLVYEWTSGQMPDHVWRAIAGGPMGCVAAVLIILFLRETPASPVPARRQA